MRKEYDSKKMKGPKNPCIQDLKKFKGKIDLGIDRLDQLRGDERTREIHQDLLNEEQGWQEPEGNED